MQVALRNKDADVAHNYLTDLDYGYSEIREVMSVAVTDPGQQWFGIPVGAAEFEHAVRFDRKSSMWEVAETGSGA